MINRNEHFKTWIDGTQSMLVQADPTLATYLLSDTELMILWALGVAHKVRVEPLEDLRGWYRNSLIREGLPMNIASALALIAETEEYQGLFHRTYSQAAGVALPGWAAALTPWMPGSTKIRFDQFKETVRYAIGHQWADEMAQNITHEGSNHYEWHSDALGIGIAFTEGYWVYSINHVTPGLITKEPSLAQAKAKAEAELEARHVNG